MVQAQRHPFLGAFSPDEYDRFACQTIGPGAHGPDSIHSSIRVLLNGTVVAFDQALPVLQSLVTYML